MNNLPDLLKLAENSAKAAGAILLEGTEGFRKVNTDLPRDIKIQADIESETLIRKLLAEETNFSIIGEEKGGDPDLLTKDEYFWVVDPLDGTFNYFRNLPMCCVSIGLMRGNTPVLGVIYDFYRDELLSGIVGQGFYINGQAFSPQWADSIDQASLVTGFPAGMDTSTDALAQFISRVQMFRKVRLLGSAAMAIGYVAAGRVDVYYEEGVRLWDVAAGLALVQAAGGTIRMSQTGSKPLQYDIWAASSEDLIPH